MLSPCRSQCVAEASVAAPSARWTTTPAACSLLSRAASATCGRIGNGNGADGPTGTHGRTDGDNLLEPCARANEARARLRATSCKKARELKAEPAGGCDCSAKEERPSDQSFPQHTNAESDNALARTVATPITSPLLFAQSLLSQSIPILDFREQRSICYAYILGRFTVLKHKRFVLTTYSESTNHPHNRVS